MSRTMGAYNTRTVAPALQRVWQSMRIMRSRFSVGELITTAESGKSQTQKYVTALHRAGYLRLAQSRVNGRPGSHNAWALVRDSGPVAPIVRYDGSAVYDRNTGLLWGMDGKQIQPARADAEVPA